LVALVISDFAPTSTLVTILEYSTEQM